MATAELPPFPFPKQPSSIRFAEYPYVQSTVPGSYMANSQNQTHTNTKNCYNGNTIVTFNYYGKGCRLLNFEEILCALTYILCQNFPPPARSQSIRRKPHRTKYVRCLTQRGQALARGKDPKETSHPCLARQKR